MTSFYVRTLCLSTSLSLLLFVTLCSRADEEKEEPKKEPTVISLSEGRVELKAPTEWETKKPQTRIVDYEFAVPPVEGDETPGRVTVMGAGGGVVSVTAVSLTYCIQARAIGSFGSQAA
jgi:hypothetical protein